MVGHREFLYVRARVGAATSAITAADLSALLILPESEVNDGFYSISLPLTLIPLLPLPLVHGDVTISSALTAMPDMPAIYPPYP